MQRRHRRFICLALVTAACARQPAFTMPPMGATPFPVDSGRAELLGDGVTHRVIHSPRGPWTINVLYVELERCNAVEPVEGTGRTKTTAMLAQLSRTQRVLGGVNADFFDLKTGAPTNLLVIGGKMLTPPIKQPVLAFDSAGVPHIGLFTLDNGKLRPFHPLEAVGGRPVLVRDSTILSEVDTFGQTSFRERNPRTAAGIARNGTRLILAVIDGREYQNAGMTLRETADLMLALGALDAINLDGGGSTTMVVADPDSSPGSSGTLRIVNHPSDKEGERAVGDALAIVNRCATK